MELELVDVFILIGLSQGVLFSLALLFGKLFSDNTNRFLAHSVLITVIIGLDVWASEKGLNELYYFIDFFGDDVPWILLFYVPIFVFILKSVQYNNINHKKLWMFTLPFIVFLFLNILIDLDMDFNLIKVNYIVENRGIIYALENYLAMTFTIIQCIIGYFLIVKSQIPNDNKRWLKYIWFFTLVLILIGFIQVFVPVLNQNQKMDYLLWMGVSVFIYWLIYKGLYQLYLAKDKKAIHEIIDKSLNVKGISEIAPKKNRKGSDKENIYIEKLEHLLRIEHIYRDPNLGLNDIAKSLGLSHGYLSEIINTSLGQNFTSYINSYRVDEAKKMLIDETFSQYSVLAIGLESGFKSKSAFYSTFKSNTGYTPNQFRTNNKF